MNGDSTSNCEVTINVTDKTIYSKTLELINWKLNMWMANIEKIRLFNQEGMEIYEEDMKFLENKEVLYVSKGENFNVNTYYSEYTILKILG